jgi:hypothetical protein
LEVFGSQSCIDVSEAKTLEIQSKSEVGTYVTADDIRMANDAALKAEAVL